MDPSNRSAGSTKRTEPVDQYDRTARLAPAYLTLFPLLVLIIALFGQEDWWQQIVAVIVAAGIPILLSDVVRQLGKTNQQALFDKWGGVPTTQFLRHHPSDANEKENNKVLRAERHKHVLRVTGLALPSEVEEQADASSLDRYDAAIALIRPYANQQPLVARENAHYGFWRNLYGLRHYVVAIGLLGLVTSGILFWLDVEDTVNTSKPWLVVEAALSLSWIILACRVITEASVKRSANSYAREVLQSLPLLPSKTTDDSTGHSQPA